MKLDRILNAMDGLEAEGFEEAHQMLCCFAILIKECQKNENGHWMLNNMSKWYFGKDPNEFRFTDIKKELEDE